MRVLSKKGYTLLEMVIYTAIFSIMAVLVINSLFVMTKSLRSIKLSRDINNSAQISLERMAREIRLADSIDGTSTLGTHPGYLKLNTVDRTTGTPTTVEFSLVGGQLMITEGASPAVALTSPDLEVTNIVFNDIPSLTLSEAVKIDFEIRADIAGKTKTENFYNTIVLRGSY